MSSLMLMDAQRMVEIPRITSRQNPRVKAAARLRIGRERGRSGRFLIDGAREISRAVAAGVHCLEAFVCEELCGSEEGRAAVEALRASGTELLSVSPEVYTKLAFGERNEGIVAVAQTPRRSLADLKHVGWALPTVSRPLVGRAHPTPSLPTGPFIAVVEGIEKPGNLGAILRSADAAGVDAVIVAGGRTDLYNPNTIRASLGTVFRDNVCEASTSEALAWVRERRVPTLAARPDAELLYTDIDFTAGAAIILGSEAEGLSDAWRGTDVTAIRLPMRGLADSLNVSTTAAVLFYEALRQRKGDGSHF